LFSCYWHGKAGGCQSHFRDGIFQYKAEAGSETDTDLLNTQAHASAHKGLIGGFDLHPA